MVNYLLDRKNLFFPLLFQYHVNSNTKTRPKERFTMTVTTAETMRTVLSSVESGVLPVNNEIN